MRHYNSARLIGACVLLIWITGGIANTASTATAAVQLVGPTGVSGIEAYTVSEAQRVFSQCEHVALNQLKTSSLPAGSDDLFVVGTAANNPVIAQLVSSGFVQLQTQQGGYSMICAPRPDNPNAWLLAVVGVDNNGTLNGLRDLEHYQMGGFSYSNGRVTATSFARQDHARIQNRGLWDWGCMAPDRKAWMEQMSRWKMNEWTVWDNYPPARMKEYVDFGHSRGIKTIAGFGLGWNPDWNYTLPPEFDHGVSDRDPNGRYMQMCSSNTFNRQFFQTEVLKKIQNDYLPAGVDGIYFQTFTEVPLCQCADCKGRTMGQLLLDFINPIVAAIKQQYPNLSVALGVHADHGDFSALVNLDPRCSIIWENCDSGTSIRGPSEDYGYINKNLPYWGGFGKDTPADPHYTEASLAAYMASTAGDFEIGGGLQGKRNYMAGLQAWAAGLLGKSTANKHASTVADGSVFSRRTPFAEAALAEAEWNPSLDTQTVVAAIDSHLGRPTATAFHWNATGSESWCTAFNWAEGYAPWAGNDAYISNGATVNHDAASLGCGRLHLEQGNLNITKGTTLDVEQIEIGNAGGSSTSILTIGPCDKLNVRSVLCVGDHGRLQQIVGAGASAGSTAIDVSGDVVLGAGSALAVTVENGACFQQGDQFDVITYDGALTGKFTSFDGGGAFELNYAPGRIYLTALVSIPEPNPLSLLSVGALTAAYRRRSLTPVRPQRIQL